MKPFGYKLDAPDEISKKAALKFPGLYALNSSEEKNIINLRKKFEIDDKNNNEIIRFTGEAIEAGLLPEDVFPAGRMPVLEGMSELAQAYLGQRSLVRIDEQIRFCRCVLDSCGYPYDKDHIIVSDNWLFWEYASIENEHNSQPTDPLSAILTCDQRYSPTWYAAKFLAHAERGSKLLNITIEGKITPESVFSLTREWMLAGETWAEAKFITNFGKFALSGRRTSEGGRAGHDKTYGSSEERARKRAEIVLAWNAERTTGHSKTTADSIVAERLGISEKTVRRARSGQEE